MRLWSLHPHHLDAKGLVALWREGLLAKAVLEEKTKGYTNHPQLIRFKRHRYPLKALNYYLLIVQEEATARGYSFDKTKIRHVKHPGTYPLTQGQFNYEQLHLQKKLITRDKHKHTENKQTKWGSHPLFCIVDGEIEDWEKT
ncbi:hypothetical protein EXS73_02800 [Candidatus Pacearchaeota archaeon]|nr:hypothetical protein [Candidatus Pacearchaeota archaeon]